MSDILEAVFKFIFRVFFEAIFEAIGLYLSDGPRKGFWGALRYILLTLIFGAIGLAIPYIYFINLPDMNTGMATGLGIIILLVYLTVGVYWLTRYRRGKSSS